jgi:hypothetical protein
MQVAVYPDLSTGTPYLCIMYPCLDEIEEAAEKVLADQGIPYKIVESDSLPQNARWVFNALTVDLSGSDPVYDYDLDLARSTALGSNSAYWNAQYSDGLAELGMTEVDINLALSLPIGDRTEAQTTALEFVSEVSAQKQAVASELQSATSGEELNAILEIALG